MHSRYVFNTQAVHRRCIAIYAAVVALRCSFLVARDSRGGVLDLYLL